MGVHDSAKKIVAGDVAHDAADSGNPIKFGGKAATSEPAAVANGDRVNAYFDATGRLVVNLAGLTAAGQATMANSFPVVIASNQGALQIGQVFNYVNVPGATVAAAGGSAYAVGDTVGTLLTLSSVTNNKAALLKSIHVKFEPVSGSAFDVAVVIFNAEPSSSTFTDNLAMSIDASDVAKISAVIPLVTADFISATGAKMASKGGLDTILDTSGTLYAAILAQGAFQPNANTYSILFGFHADA